MRTFNTFVLVVLTLLTSSVGYAQTAPLTYSTIFPFSENPISEGSRWINGKSVGLDWSNVRVTSGLANGTQSGDNGFDDSVALVSGNWGPDQMAQATVHSVNQSLDYFEEVELWLRGNITADSVTGYEINFRATGDFNAGYMQIVRWNGPLGNYSYVNYMGNGVNGVKSGDIVKASINGNTITVWVNNIQVGQATDNAIASGKPGMGFYLQGANSGVNADYGFTNFTASDLGAISFGPAPQPNTKLLRGDFNGDGNNDILWQNIDGSSAMWLMNGLSAIGGGVLLGPGTGWSVQQVGDFNGDGKSDILWQNTDGSSAIWLMDGISTISGGGILGPGTGWSVKRVGDFNGDGKTDLFWQNIDGSAAIWLMDGVNALSGTGLVGPASGWSIQNVGDFNGDGNSDIVWQNLDGRAAIWLMNGLSVLSGGGLIGPASGWSVAQIGDFNGDGKSDILWQNTDGSVAMWLMNGLSVSGGSGLLGAGTGWSVNRIGDLNGDAKSDIVWQHTDGSSAVWLMNGLSVSGGSGLLGAGTGWSVSRVGDYNNDNNNDIVWQHTDGRTDLWLMNGLNASAQGRLLGPGTNWRLAQ
jgi:hypothetical protein